MVVVVELHTHAFGDGKFYKKMRLKMKTWRDCYLIYANTNIIHPVIEPEEEYEFGKKKKKKKKKEKKEEDNLNNDDDSKSPL